ncbi:MAG TPA: DUF885 domain-containing protein, partial [Thermoanaerobaculia bacterium]|nr:DUF885 domain-containing protein [Thermoanaerobaculia bacterium]
MRKLALLLVLFAGCATQPTMNPGDATLDPLLRTYVVGFLRLNPTVNTYLGGSGLDPSLRDVEGRLRDHSAPALAREDQWLKEMEGAISGVDPATLSARARIDREVALAQIRYQLHLHQVRRYQQRSVDTYTDEPFRGVDFQLQGLSQTGTNTYGTPEEWRLLIQRVNAVPWFLANAEQQLRSGIESNNTADFRMLFRNGINTAESDAKYFEATLPKIAAERMAAGPEREALLGELRAASLNAAAAYRRFRDFISQTFLDDATREEGIKPRFAGDRFLLGEAEYDWALRNNLRIGKTTAQLYEEAWPIVERTQREMIDLAREIGRKNNWTLPADGLAAVRHVFDQLGNDSPKSDEEMVKWYRDAAFRLVEYARRTGIFDVPADYKLDVVETPAPLRASIDGAAYYPAPPFKGTGVGRFYVSPTDNDPAALRENNRSALADLSAHEGFPGHDWYYKVMSAKPPSAVRWLTPGAVEDSSSMWEDSMSAEGWGLYAEALMAEPQPGAPNGFYTPEERLYQLQGKLYRDLRVRIDTGIHTGRIKYGEAVDMWSQIVDFLPGSCRHANLSDAKRSSCRGADRAIFRYSKWPTQAITYRIGKDEIYALREEAARRLGSRFDLKTFHLRFIEQGTIPAGYFREELL